MKMNEQNFDVNKLSVAKPCSMSWENMSGDEKTRLCNACDMNIYNLSEMTTKEITSLIQNREDRLCGRIYKRTDGTAMTKDCPVGLSAYRKKISRFAGAAFATILSLFSVGYSQSDNKNTEKNGNIKITRVINQNNEISIKGIVVDSSDARIPNAEIILRKKNNKFKNIVRSNGEGRFEFGKIPADKYVLEVKLEGFDSYKNKNFIVGKKEFIEIKITLEMGEPVVVGIFLKKPLTNMTESGITNTISGEDLRRIPNR